MNADTMFLKYYFQYYEKIYHYLYFRLHEDKSLAEDLTSETFLKAFEKFNTYDQDRSFGSWIYAIARNCLIDYVRKHPLDQEVSLPDEKEQPINSDNKTWTRTDQLLTRTTLLQGVFTLPENLQELIMLKYFNDYTNKEIEDLLNINPNTLRVQLHRATKMLQSCIPPNLLGLLLLFFIL